MTKTTMTSVKPETISQTLAKFSRSHRTAQESAKVRDETYNKLLKHITLMRVRKDMPIRTLADKSGVSHSAIVNYLYNGLTTMSVEQIKKMVKVLDEAPAKN